MRVRAFERYIPLIVSFYVSLFRWNITEIGHFMIDSIQNFYRVELIRNIL